MKSQRGFTLIELVVVIIILGVLSAVAVPRFNNISIEARNAAARGVGGALSTATSLNYASRAIGTAGAIIINQANVCGQGVLLAPLVADGGVILVNAAPTTDKQFRLVASTTAGANASCAAAGNATTAICGILAYGSGAVAQDVAIVCAR